MMLATGAMQVPDDTGPLADMPVALSPSMSAEQVLRWIIADACRRYDQHLAQLIETDHPDGPRKTRVALRRLRSTLKGYRPILKHKATARFDAQARKIFRLIGHVRDADVALDLAPDADVAGGIGTLRQQVRARLRSLGAVGFGARLAGMINGDTWQRRGKAQAALRCGPSRDFARQALAAAWARCIRHRAHLARLSVEQRHDLRKDLKTFRYLSEFFGPFWPDDVARPSIHLLKRLQDELGTLNDFADLRAKGKIGKPQAALHRERLALALATAQTHWHDLRSLQPWWQAETGQAAA
ncbi:MAG: CHAD domain-containing protein [Pseudomonadota bacterium]